MKKNIKIAIDLDGVLRDFDGYLRELLKSLNYLKPQDQINETEYNLNKRYKIGIDVRKFVFTDHPTIFFRAPMYPQATEFVLNLKKENEKVGIITAQAHDISWVYTTKWLTNHKILQQLDFLIRVKDGSEKWKEDFDVLLDDKAEIVEECLTHDKIAFIMDRPWNRYSNAPRVHSYKEFLEEVKKIRS